MADTKISALPLATATADAQEIEVNDAGTSKKVKLQDILEHGYVRGGTTAAANLILDSTSHATKGKTLFGASGAYDEANGRLGVGTQSPTLLGEFKGPPSLTSVAVRIQADPTAPAVGDQALINLSAQNSSNAVVNYGVISGRAETVTAGSEDGRLLFLVEVNSVSTQLMELRGSTKTVELASGVALKVGTPTISSGSGTPEGVVTAPVGSIFMRTDGGAGTSHYVKESGAGNTGWIAK